MSKCISILGLVGAGKDTFAAELQKHLPDYTIDRYARPLKVLTADIYGCTLADLEDRVFKEKPQQVPRDVMLDKVFSCLVDVLEFNDEQLDISSELFFEHFSSSRAIAPREFQQIFGTDIVRAVKPNAWVDCVRGQDKNLILPDARFLNEVGDVNILVQRFTDIPRPAHSSEHLAWDLQFSPSYASLNLRDLYVIANYESITLTALAAQAKGMARNILQGA